MARPTTQELQELKEALTSLIKETSELKSDLENQKRIYIQNNNQLVTKVKEANERTLEIESIAERCSEHEGEISEHKEASITKSETINQIFTASEKLQAKLEAQALELKNLTSQASSLNKTIESLLPGATSSGLASAFKERKEKFAKPKLTWAAVFIISIILLLLIAFIGTSHSLVQHPSYSETILQIIRKLPFIVPIVWLAIYSGRRHSQALRLEEDYAHKEAISKSFEGYKKQLQELEVEGGESTYNLITRTLEALSLHPDRIYSGKHEDIHPISMLFGCKHNSDKSSSSNQ